MNIGDPNAAQEADDETKVKEDEAAGPRVEEIYENPIRRSDEIQGVVAGYFNKPEEQEDEAGRRDPVEPYTIKLNLMNMQHVTINRVTVPWLDWLHSLLQWHGVSLETGFTPIGSIAHIERIVDDAPVTGGNVVLFSGGKK